MSSEPSPEIFSREVNPTVRVECLPIDILLLIFEEATSTYGHLPWPHEVYDDLRARAAFSIASVCRIWREIALVTPALWTYFGFQKGNERLVMLELRAARSREAPIDIFLHPESTSPSPEVFRCISRLHDMASRWRMVNIRYPAAVSGGIIMDCLTRPTPYLQSLVITSRMSGAHRSARLSVLPQAPYLKRMFIDDLAINWTIVRSISTYALTELSIWLFTWPVDLLCSLLTELSGTLKILALLGKTSAAVEGLDDTSAIAILPNLASLVVQRTSWLRIIRAPALKNLEMWATVIADDEKEVLRSFSGVQSLVLWGQVSLVDVELLSVFTDVTSVRFAVNGNASKIYGMNDDMCQIDQGFFHSVANDDPIWPALRELAFGNDNLPISEVIEVDLDDLSALVRRRNQPMNSAKGFSSNRLVLRASASAPSTLKEAIKTLNNISSNV